MAIEITGDIFRDIVLHAQQQGEIITQPLELGFQRNLPQQLGEGINRIFNLRDGLILDIRHCRFKQTTQFIQQHESSFPLTAKFYLSGASQVTTSDALHITPEYEEIKGCHYLYHLPNQTEIEQWTADEPVHVVMLYVNPSYFSKFDAGKTKLSPSLRKLFEGDETQRFHQSLGQMTPTIKQLLQQILHCPYTGLMEQMYLESKAIELFAAQFALWTETATPNAARSPAPRDIEQLYQAREILIQQATNPPSLIDLARQVGLNDRKLKQGFRHLFGTTTFGYLRDYRLQQAKELLHNRNLTIASVAATVGYRSPEAFCNAFRRKFDVSPKAYQLSRFS